MIKVIAFYSDGTVKYFVYPETILFIEAVQQMKECGVPEKLIKIEV